MHHLSILLKDFKSSFSLLLRFSSFFLEMIDRMIQDSDKNKDGFINYQEYKNTRRPDGL